MHEDIEEVVKTQDGASISVIGKYEVKVSGPKGELSRKFPCEISIDNGNAKIFAKGVTKNQKKLIKSCAAHIRNMVKGVLEGYSYSLQICTVHFPMNVSIANGQVIIKNFLGEAKERKAKVLPGVEAKIDGDFIRIFSASKEAAGQTAANIESATRVRKRDRRVFQDGIWIIKKPDEEFL